MSEKQQGAGSVWNINSWHWENKNYTPIAEKLLTEKFNALSINKDSILITTVKVKSCKGEAQINIRKGKQILCYEFDVEVQWRGEKGLIECEGSYKVTDINESDLDFEVGNITVNEKNEISDDAKTIIRKQMKQEIENSLKNFNESLMQHESDPEKLQKDKDLREAVVQNTQKVRAETGALKEQMLEEQREKERKFKEENFQKHLNKQ